MDRPNITTSPKSVQRYIQWLEQELGRKDTQIATLTRDATTADDWRGPFVAYVDADLHEPRTPLARVRERIYFTPREGVNISVRWAPDEDALEVMDQSPAVGPMRIEPMYPNKIRVRGAKD